ncbi:MAG TPA: hypothetical protein VGY56_20365 [Verrucomicrobiae bacterium]|nr:hypothetical protein [Verrucomicrobiae bacterium]
MSANFLKKSDLLFMKVGLHAGESLEEILVRKRREFDAAGMIFWGYGGGTCHPSKCVQPFAKVKVSEGGDVYIVMERINSRHGPTEVVATEYSEDGLVWNPIPKGIAVRGSRYAVVLDELQMGDLEIDLSQYKVAAGPSTGKVASKYISGHVDKACITENERPPEGIGAQIKKIEFYAKLKAPYAVFTR